MPAVTPLSSGVITTPSPLPIDLATAITACQEYASLALARFNSARSLFLGAFASDASAVAFAAAQTPPIALINGTRYFNTTSNSERVYLAPTTSWTGPSPPLDNVTNRQLRLSLISFGLMDDISQNIPPDPNDPVNVAWNSGAGMSLNDDIYAWIAGRGHDALAILTYARTQHG